MDISEIKEWLEDDWRDVQRGISSRLSSDIDLLEMVNSSLLKHSGKQLRPLLSILIARACGGTLNSSSINYAVAAELLHNATLLHDDVADVSDFRRGVPTIRKTMGPSASVLVGDFWLVRALRAILDSEIGRDRAIDIFATTLSDLAEGEMLQLQKASSLDTDFDAYLKIIYCKTASLFVASARTAAISVNASPQVESVASEYGRLLGCAFQMRDDIFDYMPDAQVGKPVGVDIMERKITLPLLCAFENVGKECVGKIRRKLSDVTVQTRDEILDFVRDNGGLEAAQTTLEEYSERAVAALYPLSGSKEKDCLVELARYTASRII